MGIVVQPTAYITWIPKGNIILKPTEAYITWLPFGTIHVKPQIIGSFVPDSIQRVKADTLRHVGQSVSITGDTARQICEGAVALADTKRAVGTEVQASGDTNRSVGEHQTAQGDTLRHAYLPNGVFVEPMAYISWLPMGEIVIRPQIVASWMPMGKIHLKPQLIASLVTPWQWHTTVRADTCRKVSQANDVSADISREVKSTNTVTADTWREVYSRFIAVATADLLRRTVLQNEVVADTQWMVGGELVVIHADTQRLTGADYCVAHGDTWRSVTNVAKAAADTLRIRGIGNTVSGDMFRMVGREVPAASDLLRTVAKRERVLADTSIRVPWVLEYVNRRPPVRAKAKRLQAAATTTPITQNFHDHGIRSFSMTLGELTLSDTFQLETVQPMNIDDAVQGQIFDYQFHFLVEETGQRDLLQTVKGMYSKDALLCTAINATVSELNVSCYARQIAAALGLELNIACDDFIPSQNFENCGMTYQDMISALFGWTSKLPQRQINVFIRGNTLNIIQRGLEQSVIDISDWPHSRPTIERKLIRSIWHSNNNDDADNQAHNEEDDAPVPFTGTISHEDISYTYVEGYLVRERNENGETNYSYQDEYDHKGNLTGKYVSRKETWNKDGSVNLVEYVYAAASNNIYLFKEHERSREPRDTPTYMDEWDSERITYHAPIGYGWYATTVYEDGERVGSSLSQGAPGGKASQYTIDQSALSLGSHYFSYYDEDEGDVPFSSLIDTEFPVKGDEYLRVLTQAIEWLNRKTQETVTMEIHANIRDGVPDAAHIVDFTERIQFDGNEYFLCSNSVELTPRSLRQTIRMTRWY